ncbi:glycoside hydrolase family 2 TIM barrel-domain containing protein [Abyssalbus ytuae]|uniref:DUF4982 domain-containing protein n=1 Tax=Abyssalbus ytuae TaxID=2926907 RepID=A0A9E6ZTR9_9FLAO|nr:glycoside hydrolase family 2 TIM barrel-domain containing protein [Abyssalbus ytuae]UOB18738.1 DUF4982 domain-containing protein [Abyssalbus ytuae]
MYNKFYIKTTTVLYALFMVSFFACEFPESQNQMTRKASFNTNWNFYLTKDTLDSINASTQWRKLNLPHDWSIESTFFESHPSGHGGGYLSGGLGWYKKTFNVKDSTKLTSIIFDGIYMNSEAWINGHYLGKRPNGYISFEYNLTPYLNYGDKNNELLVKVNNSKQPNSRWYSGSGIYRNVWLKTVNKTHIINNGTFIITPKVSDKEAIVLIEITLNNQSDVVKKGEVLTTIYQNSNKINSVSKEIPFDANPNQSITQELIIKNPKLWSVESPTMYTAVTQVKIDNQIVDEYKTPFGIRTFRFTTDKGFILNGKPLKIKGVCQHHDLGPLGTAINYRALERQLEILKDMGVNGIRTAHNPPAPELLELCDKMGFIVMDESYDMWKTGKTKYDYSNYWDEWHIKDLEDFIIRDRNHPSVFIWSIGNEISDQWSEEGVEIAKELTAIIKKLDSTRPITAGMNPPVNMKIDEVTLQFDEANTYFNNLAKSGALDLIGYNYAHQTWVHHQENFPGVPFIATETTSALQTRGYYDFPSDTMKIWPKRWDIPFDGGTPGNTCSAFDQVRAPWGSLHETSWKIIKKHDFMSGMYIWTGFDYIGEPTPYVWPSRSSYFGVIDLAGFPKDVYYMYQSEWTNKDVLYVFPHWNWNKGQMIDVWTYYNHADEVELYVNGKSQGIRKKQGDDLHVMWRIPFEAGVLKVVSRKDGKIVLQKEIKTAGEASGLNLIADRNTIKANGTDLSFVTVEIIDSDGNIVPTAQNNIHFELKGEGKIVGVSSGDPTNHQSFKGIHHKALNGKCLVIVQSGEMGGTLQLTATSEGLQNKAIKIIMN